MLVLSRKREESIVIGDSIEIKIIDIKGDHIKVGIIAPKAEKIYRKEIFLEIQKENIVATKHIPNMQLLTKLVSQGKSPEGKIT